MFLPLPKATLNAADTNAHRTSDNRSAPQTKLPDPQVPLRAQRRPFTNADKLRILAQADACPPGQLGAFLRREGLYASTLRNFRKQQEEGKLGRDPRQAQQQRREREAARQRETRTIARLEAENQKLRALLELQKKVAELLNVTLQSPTDA